MQVNNNNRSFTIHNIDLTKIIESGNNKGGPCHIIVNGHFALWPCRKICWDFKEMA
jgi:hypothetical protein